jgi:hypothetical protein
MAIGADGGAEDEEVFRERGMKHEHAPKRAAGGVEHPPRRARY